MRFVIEVTYGTRAHHVYATAESLEDARALKRGAISLGYTDAKIVPEKDFNKAKAQDIRSKADQAAAPCETRELHDMRPRPRSAVA